MPLCLALLTYFKLRTKKARERDFYQFLLLCFSSIFLPELTLKRDCPEDLEDILGF
jgi:hypothetical protein